MAKKKKANHYIDNKEFFGVMCEWKEAIKAAEDAGEPKPVIPDYVGECFLKIAEHLSFKPNFINYPFKDDMIGDGIENCVMYASNFDPEKSTNPSSIRQQSRPMTSASLESGSRIIISMKIKSTQTFLISLKMIWQSLNQRKRPRGKSLNENCFDQ